LAVNITRNARTSGGEVNRAVEAMSELTVIVGRGVRGGERGFPRGTSRRWDRRRLAAAAPCSEQRAPGWWQRLEWRDAARCPGCPAAVGPARGPERSWAVSSRLPGRTAPATPSVPRGSAPAPQAA